MSSDSILLVDDEVALLDLFSVSLRGLPNPVLKASSGHSALDIMEQQRPAVVVLDIAMPDMTGLEVLRRIRNNPKLDDVKVLILTAVPIMMDQESAALADGVLSKPINVWALQDAVKNLLTATTSTP